MNLDAASKVSLSISTAWIRKHLIRRFLLFDFGEMHRTFDLYCELVAANFLPLAADARASGAAPWPTGVRLVCQESWLVLGVLEGRNPCTQAQQWEISTEKPWSTRSDSSYVSYSSQIN